MKVKSILKGYRCKDCTGVLGELLRSPKEQRKHLKITPSHKNYWSVWGAEKDE